MPYPFSTGDSVDSLDDLLNDAVLAAKDYTDEKSVNASGIYTLIANESISQGTRTTVPNFYLNEGVSTANIGSFVSLNTDAGRGVWTFLTSGYYQVLLKSQWAINNTGYRYLYPYIDNVEVDVETALGSDARLNLSYVFGSLYFSAGQDIRMRVLQNAGAPGSSLSLIGAPGSYATQMFFQYLGSTA